MKILMSAYACEPSKGSEPSVGWNQVCQVARDHEVWVITRSNNRPGIDEALAVDPLPNAHWVYFDLPRWASFWKKGMRGMRTYYHCWQFGAYLKARSLHRQFHFDLAHHVTFVNYWMPIFLALLPVPFVWGPVGGGESAPRHLRRALSLRGRIYESLRDFARRMGEMNPIVRMTARRAAVALAATRETEQRLYALGCKRVSVFSQVALPQQELHELLSLPLPSRKKPFRVLSLGRLLHLKGWDFGLRAFARFHAENPDSEYWIVGGGPEAGRLKRMADELRLGDSLVFWGAVSRARVFEMLGECDVLLFPCLHDSGGWASVEAMAAGRPVICLDLGGPALLVTDATGIKVAAIAPEQVLRDLAAALTDLSSDMPRLMRLGQQGRERVRREFNWEKKGQDLARIYSEIAREAELQLLSVSVANDHA